MKKQLLDSLKIVRKKYGKNHKRTLKVLLQLAKLESESTYQYRLHNFKTKFNYSS